MENNNKKINEDFEKLMNSIQVVCPVYKLNLDNNTKQYVLGLYLMCFDENHIETILKDKAMMDDVKNSTILFFDKHHIIELCNLFHGIFSILIDRKYISKEMENSYIASIASFINSPMVYNDYLNYCDNIYNTLTKNYSVMDEIAIRIKTIMKYICFVSYSDLDELVKEAIDEYKKNNKEEEE